MDRRVEEVDVLICGSGSAGLCAATWLARCGIRCKIIEKREGPLKMGQADGVQCRTVEVFESFGIAEEMLREAYHVLEVDFWASNGKGGIHRTNRTADTLPGLSHQPHVILNQARLNALLIGAMRNFNNQDVDYGYEVQSVKVNSASAHDQESFPVTVATEKGGKEIVFHAKYVLGCDGAHSAVRRSLGFSMIGDSTDHVWGVMDVYPQTNFPDIRKKCAIHSDAGSLIIIPREGRSLARFYIELPDGTVAKDVKLEDLQSQARRMFAPYSMEFADTFWWSAYSIGQRLADHFAKDNRVFLTGDACHTHSPKAGQGMNVSLQDGYNIGWKLASVLHKQAHPDLLETYVLERYKVGKDLIDFDRYWTKLFSRSAHEEGSIAPEQIKEHWIKNAKYTAGLTAKYEASVITSSKTDTERLARNLVVGMRFPSAQVIRFCDVKAMPLVQALPADGRWRIVVFAGDPRDSSAAKDLTEVSIFDLPTAWY